MEKQLEISQVASVVADDKEGKDVSNGRKDEQKRMKKCHITISKMVSEENAAFIHKKEVKPNVEETKVEQRTVGESSKEPSAALKKRRGRFGLNIAVSFENKDYSRPENKVWIPEKGSQQDSEQKENPGEPIKPESFD